MIHRDVFSTFRTMSPRPSLNFSRPLTEIGLLTDTTSLYHAVTDRTFSLWCSYTYLNISLTLSSIYYLCLLS